MSIPIRKMHEIKKMRCSSELVYKTLQFLKESLKPGLTLLDIDQMGEQFIRSQGGRPSFKGLYGFSGSVCTSLNEVIIHGKPSEIVIKEGDILGLDVGVEIDGWYGDAAITTGIGEVSREAEDIMRCSFEALEFAISHIRSGMYFKEISELIENYIVSCGYVPLRNYCGHGIGKKPHIDPEIPNYLSSSNAKQGPKVKNGMVFCLEPMVCQKSGNPKILEDKWSVVSEDGQLGSHHEHTIAVINDRACILSTEDFEFA